MNHGMDQPRTNRLLAKQVLSRRSISPGMLVLLVALGVGLALAAWPELRSVGGGRDEAALSQAKFEDETGVRVLRVAVTAGGGILDLRYQVIDPDKAVAIHDEENPPTIVDEKSGETFDVPWMAHANRRTLKAGVTYYELILNRGGLIRPGSKVTVILAGFRLEHVTVR